MTTDASGAADDEHPSSARIPIAERAARRRELEERGHDSPEGLLRHFRAGRDTAVTRRGRFDLAFHPIARKLVLGSLALVAAYLAITFVVAQIRDVRVDTWSGPAGPDPAVQSGMRLEGCAAFHRTDDPVFPNWVRIDDKVYQPTGAQLPVGESNVGVYYLDSGYTFDNLRIYRVEQAGLGEPGTRILVRAGDAPAGGLFSVIPGCS